MIFGLFILACVPAFGTECGSAWGGSAGVTVTGGGTDSSSTFAASGSFECLGKPKVRPEAALGGGGLKLENGESSGYAFLVGGLRFGKGVSGSVSVGVYDVPTNSRSGRQSEFGYNAGVRFLMPAWEKGGYTIEALGHAVQGDGPSSLFTLTIGVLFW